MEYYDVIIVGAGIAGCGLAYNLKRIGYKGSVLVIDKKGVGANVGYGYRNTFKEIIDEYGLLYEHKYEGLKYCMDDKEYMTIDAPFYFVNYQKICKTLIMRSFINFKKEEAIYIKDNNLKTKKSDYKFRYLVDCSGNNFFLKNILKQNKPSMF